MLNRLSQEPKWAKNMPEQWQPWLALATTLALASSRHIGAGQLKRAKCIQFIQTSKVVVLGGSKNYF